MSPRIPNIFAVTFFKIFFVTAFFSTSVFSADEPGKYIGVKPYEPPAWFKESFLEIAEDATESEAADKHLVLFFHLDACPYCDKVLLENFHDDSDNIDFVKSNFDVIALNIKGDREVVFDEATTLPESDLAGHLGVKFTPTMLFIDSDNKPVLRLNGYKSVDEMNHAFEYVRSQSYLSDQSLAQYILKAGGDVYAQRPNAQFVEADNLQDLSLEKQKILLLFEDSSCGLCDTFHDQVLSDPELAEVLQQFTIVRLDAGSEREITTPDGERMSAAAYADQLKLDFRPGLVFLEQGQEITRIDTLLINWHYYILFRWVAEDAFKEYANVWDFGAIVSEQHLAAGKDIDLRQ